MNISKTINTATQSGQMAEMVKSCWELSAASLISNVYCKQNKSQHRVDNTVYIGNSVKKKSDNNNMVMMTEVINKNENNKSDVNMKSSPVIEANLPPMIPPVVITDYGGTKSDNEESE